MEFHPHLKCGKLLKRYKRFFADIEVDGEVVTAHLPNTGSLKTVPLTETECFFSSHDNPSRKLKHTLEVINSSSGLIGVNTRTPNQITDEALKKNTIHRNFSHHQAEVKISEKSRIDFVLWNSKSTDSAEPVIKKLSYPEYLNNKDLDLHFIEVKNVTMAEDQTAMFPDGVSARALKHLEELMHLRSLGFGAEILFVIQRENVTEFKAASHIDPAYAKTLKKANDKGVIITALKTKISTEKIELTDNSVKVIL